MKLSMVVRTKITPPSRNERVIYRSRVIERIADARYYRLMILQAGAGFGKSTAITALASGAEPLIWYQVSKEDTDPLVFLLHLCHAILLVFPDMRGLPTSDLESWDSTRGPVPTIDFTHQILNAMNEHIFETVFLVIDDVHLVLDSGVISHILDHLISLAPPGLHTIFATRDKVTIPNLTRWVASGDVLELDQSLLAFTSQEIYELFSNCYGYEISIEEAEKLHEITEGWGVALQLIWQSLRSGLTSTITEALARQGVSLGSLFEVLAEQVMAQQPDDVQDFLRVSSTLREMNVQACDALWRRNDSAAMLAYLQRQELFVVAVGNGRLRYQYIFHKFLRQGVAADKRRQWNQIAGEYYAKEGDLASALYHYLKAEDYLTAAELLEKYGDDLFAHGRLDTLSSYLLDLPAEVFHQHPMLLHYLGDLARLHSRFREALDWYHQAEVLWRERGQYGEVSRALRGQARVYLDTVNPVKAEELLQQALRISDRIDDRQAKARLYDLLAENRLNSGKPDEANGLRQKALILRQETPADTNLNYRVLLRTGQLDTARRELEYQIKNEQRDPVEIPRSHRETLFLLSLVYSFMGESQKAFQTALLGTQRGIKLDSPFTTAVGHMRQGHALMLLEEEDRFAKAQKQFKLAVEISHNLDIPRLRVEACWGLCRVHGYQGDLSKALEMAQEGIAIAEQAGDEWIASMIRLTMGASLILSSRYESSDSWLFSAARGFQECSDSFGNVVANLWLCLGCYLQNEQDQLARLLPEVLQTCHVNNYDWLFTRSTLLGPPDPRILVPLMIYARDREWERSYIERVLHLIGLSQITSHPGYQLRVKTLGGFRVWRGFDEIPANGWRRDKTRQLFQLFITFRDSPLDREQIYEHLWPGADPEVSQRNFKVVLNTLYNVLEPGRIPGSESAYILREGNIYGLQPYADLWLDAAEFISGLQHIDMQNNNPTEEIHLLEEAIDLYQGEYLPDARYESWAASEREFIAVRFLQAADRLGELYLFQKQYSETIVVCQRILSQDNCWERAYRHMMRAYFHLGDRGQIARTFNRCTLTLRQELDVAPARETLALYNQLITE